MEMGAPLGVWRRRQDLVAEGRQSGGIVGGVLGEYLNAGGAAILAAGGAAQSIPPACRREWRQGSRALASANPKPAAAWFAAPAPGAAVARARLVAGPSPNASSAAASRMASAAGLPLSLAAAARSLAGGRAEAGDQIGVAGRRLQVEGMEGGIQQSVGVRDQRQFSCPGRREQSSTGSGPAPPAAACPGARPAHPPRLASARLH